MKKLLILGAALALSGCAGLRERVNDHICANPRKVELGARAALEASWRIKDPLARQAAQEAAQALLDAVERCKGTLPAIY